MKLSIVLLNYNKSELTINCIQSLYDIYEKEFMDNIFEIIIVDNASNNIDLQNLKEAIKNEKYKIVKTVYNKENLGFSKGCNIGAKSAKGDVILFLNNDTLVKDKGLSNMLGFINEQAEVDILGGKLTNTDGSEQASVGKFYTPLHASLFLLGLQRFGTLNKNPDEIELVDWVKGGCMMVKKVVYDKLSGFDEKLFMYIEDMEFCYRAKKAGYKTFFYPFIMIEHIDQGSSSRSFAIVNIYENLLYFYKKHRSFYEYLFLKTILKIKAIFLIIIGRVTSNKYLINTYEKALKVA